MVKIPFSALYTINFIKFRRLIRGISARKLSIKLSLAPQHIGRIESLVQEDKYTLEMLAKIAVILDCKVADFYPPDDILSKHDGEYVFKEVLSLSKVDDVTSILKGLIAYDYFKKSVSYKELCKYLHVLISNEREAVSKALDILVENNTLKFNDGLYTSK